MTKTIFFSVGEPSGDQHAARLIRELLGIDRDVQTRGFGGPAMRAAGCRLDRDLTGESVVGLLEAVPKVRRFFSYAAEAEQAFEAGEVDAVVLVDFPGFNWHIAKRAKRHGVPVIYYCPPQLWAWAAWRIRKMKRTVDEVLAVLPIEEAFYSGHGIPTRFVGHPFFDAVRQNPLDAKLMSRLDSVRESGESLVAVLPGSRDHEVHRNWPIMLASIRELHRKHPRARFLVAGYRDRHAVWARDRLAAADRSLPIEFFVGRTSELIEAADCAMMVSGSVSLELMARRTPAAVIYRVGRVLRTFARLAVRVDTMTLPNLMAGRKVFPEFVSTGDPAPAVEFLTASIDAFLGDRYYYRDSVRRLGALEAKYAQPGASANAARCLADRLAGRSGFVPSFGASTGFPAEQDTGFPAEQDTGFPAEQDTGFPAEQDTGFPAERDTGFPVGHPPGLASRHGEAEGWPHAA